MLGRSSRTRGVCEGILYVPSNDKASVVIDRLKKQNFNAMDELAMLMRLIEKRSNDKLVSTTLKKR